MKVGNNLWNGSATRLQGNSLLLVIFVSPSDREWPLEEKNASFDEIREGVEWLREQGKKYDSDFNFEIVSPNLHSNDAKVLDVQDARDLGDNLTDISIQLGYSTMDQLFDYYLQNYPDHSIVLFFAVNLLNVTDDAWGYCTGSHSTKLGIDLEFMVLFKDEHYDNKISRFTVAHEILHSFSVPDLYSYDGSIEENKKAFELAKKHVPREIMLCLEEGNYEVSPYTAFIVGWHQNPEDWFIDITQPGARKEIELMVKLNPFFDESGHVKPETYSVIESYSFYEGTILKAHHNNDDNQILWIVNEVLENGMIKTDYLIPSEEESMEGFICLKGSFHLYLPVLTGTVHYRYNIEDELSDWFAVFLDGDIVSTYRYEFGQFEKVMCRQDPDLIYWKWHENKEGEEIKAILTQSVSSNEDYIELEGDYNFRLPLESGLVLYYLEDDWIDWYEVTLQ
jgi:hypothetical protein